MRLVVVSVSAAIVVGVALWIFAAKVVPEGSMVNPVLEIQVPFLFSKKIDPRSVVTVGDQVVCEHVFGFHSRESLKEGFGSVLSDVTFDESANAMTVKPKFLLRNSEGKRFGSKLMCESIRASLRGTSHAPIAPLVKSVNCQSHQIEIQFEAIPVNIRYLFTLADFSIFDENVLPLENGKRTASTGPYSVYSILPGEIRLHRNPYYPKELVANNSDEVVIKSYAASDTARMIRGHDVTLAPLVYVYGYSIDHETLKVAQAREYRVRQMPSEWMVYWTIHRRVPFRDRKVFADMADQWRKELLRLAPLGQPAFSLSPSDRPFGLTEAAYFEAIGGVGALPSGVPTNGLSRKYILGTLDEWSGIPIFSEALDRVQKRFPDIQIRLISRKESSRLWSDEMDFVLSPVGISPADPINNFAFEEELDDLVSKAKIAELSTLKDTVRFNQELIALESKIAKERRWIPIGHFPGVVLEATGFERDERIAWSWGIQAWTYKVPTSR